MIKIYKDKIIATVYNPKTSSWEEINVLEQDESLLNYFKDEIQIDKGVTVLDLMKILQRESNVIDTVFFSWNGGIPIQVFLDWVEEHPGQENKSFKKIVFSQYIDLSEDNFELVKDMTVVDQKGDTHGLDFSQISEWYHLPIEINNNLLSDKPELNNQPITLSLFDFLATFLDELTFYGRPENQISQIKEIVQTLEEFKERSPEPITLTLEQLQDQLTQALQQEDYEAASILRDEIKRKQFPKKH